MPRASFCTMLRFVGNYSRRMIEINLKIEGVLRLVFNPIDRFIVVVSNSCPSVTLITLA